MQERAVLLQCQLRRGSRLQRRAPILRARSCIPGNPQLPDRAFTFQDRCIHPATVIAKADA